jgi:glutamate-1-semialdehyde 2,1-aminomutase
VYEHLDATARTLASLASDALGAAGVAHRVQFAGTMFSIFFTDAEVHDYATARTQDTERFKAFVHSRLAHGVYLPPSAFEAWFVSAAHDEDAVARVAEALPAAAAAAARVRAA